MAVKRGGLGKGLGALLAENTMEDSTKTFTLRISDIQPNREQPRKKFDDETLSELSASIAQHGVLQPLMVRPLTDGTYQLVAGERRWRAARMAGISEVPVIIRELDDLQAAEIALIENLQREDLNPIEEAHGYKTLMEKHGLNQEQTAQSVNKSRPAVANALRLLQLPSSVLEMVQSGELSAGHARTVLSLDNEIKQLEAASYAVKKNMSVRELERFTKRMNTKEKQSIKEDKGFTRDSFFDEVQIALTQHLGRRVKVKQSGQGGMLELEYYSKDDLKEIANILSPEK